MARGGRDDSSGSRQLTLDDWADELNTNGGQRMRVAPSSSRSSRGSAVPGRSESRRVEDVAAAQAAPAAPALLTTQEAASLLHVHPRTVQRLVERGQLKAVHLGAAVRFDPVDVADLTARLKGHEASGSPPCADTVKPSRAVRISFADRLRSRQHEHRTDNS